MAVVKINAIEVPPQAGATLEERFAARAGEVEKMKGFLSFELLRPVKGDDRYFVYTRWETDEDFQAWVGSMQFQKGHAQSSGDQKPAGSGSALLEFEVVMTAGPSS